MKAPPGQQRGAYFIESLSTRFWLWIHRSTQHDSLLNKHKQLLRLNRGWWLVTQ